MQKGSKTFKLKTGKIEDLGKKMGDVVKVYDLTMEQRTHIATNMVWRIAHQKRPYISKQQMKEQHRTKRVSDPDASLGVPVQTGTLQSSIEQRVERVGAFGKFRGVIQSSGVPYANAIEYGTSRMRARPFMRPAVELNRQAIKQLFRLRVDMKPSSS